MASEEEAGFSEASDRWAWPPRRSCRRNPCGRAFGVKEVLCTHIYLPESASTSPHEIEIRSRTLPRCVGLDRLATKSNRGKSREELREGTSWILRFGRGMACRSRSRQGSGWPWWTHEVGVVGDLGVRLHLLHATQLCAATTAPE